jgi:N-succinyldiaminopimelate aminotransferase
LFAFAQAVVDPTKHKKRVVSPNPFYQIYEGAALLAGATPYYINTTPENGFRMAWETVPEDLWETVQLVYVCSPGNPTGKVMSLEDWKAIFDLSDRHGFVIASDECYSEIYFDEASPPLGALTAAKRLGRSHKNLVVFNSLSKRSNVPGLRSGLVAGDAEVLKKFLLYRTYHGSAMSPMVQAVSAAAWDEESHVVENRRQYAAKFAAVQPILAKFMEAPMPDAAFYLWAKAPGEDDAAFARELYRSMHVTVLPGSFLAREAKGVNPGRGFVRIALVDGLPQCEEAARRISEFLR